MRPIATDATRCMVCLLVTEVSPAITT